VAETDRIAEIVLDEASIARRGPDVEHERRVAVFDLLEQNFFAPVGVTSGPYHLRLLIEENRLVFDIRNVQGEPLRRIGLGFSTFRRVIKDYSQVCDTYYQAIKTAPLSRIEAIDMGRRVIHDEGSALLRARLKDKIEVDDETARRLFTLLCAMHQRR
jgi:uncharacterized protein (UPF0262 family)